VFPAEVRAGNGAIDPRGGQVSTWRAAAGSIARSSFDAFRVPRPPTAFLRRVVASTRGTPLVLPHRRWLMRFVLGLLLGIALGVSVGLIVAPQPGSETRKALQGHMRRTAEEAEEAAV
jgi:hypothetical protein